WNNEEMIVYIKQYMEKCLDDYKIKFLSKEELPNPSPGLK
ncbi:hypothetical protein HKBW3S44_01885, partial [Candidatus Hakubella thermalkaliphila]